MQKKMCFIMGFFILAFPLLAQGFDCNKPDFGARIEDLNKDGFFIKYMEKAGISYYNYTGPCRLDMHNHINPSISYAFIDNQLYARIVDVQGEKVAGERDSIEAIRNRMEGYNSKTIGSPPFEIKQDGDWWVYQWFNEKETLKYKLKIHSKTKEGKSAFYYEPLRSKLKLVNGDDDPVLLRH